MLTDLVLRGAPIREVSSLAGEVEALGFDAVGVTETNGNPFLAAAQAAQANLQRPRRDRDRARVPAHPDGCRVHGVGPAGPFRRTLCAGPRLSGARARRAAVRGGVVASRAADARVRPRAGRHLGRVGVRRGTRLPRRFLLPHPDAAQLPSRADRTPAAAGPARGRPRADDRDRGRGGRRVPRPRVLQRAGAARGDDARARARHRARRAPARSIWR